MKRTFTVDDVEGYICDPVFEEGSGARRWSETITYGFKADDGLVYKVYFDRGLTEYQDSSFPDAYTKDGVQVVDCPEVEVYEEMVPVKRLRTVTDG